jgi:hypothetical protein
LQEHDEKPRIRERREELLRRARVCREYGFRTIFHFGAPYTAELYRQLTEGLQKTQSVEPCILEPHLAPYYSELLTKFAATFPEVDDIQVYTYDQDAWICSEFGTCPRCAGKPLHERLPSFLHALCDTWRGQRPSGTVWWEPWELSAGQIFSCIPRLPRQNFGMMLHSNIAEVQVARPIDNWFRNTARLASKFNIPTIGEVFLSGAHEEAEPLQHLIAPRLVYNELQALASVPEVIGVKEYFGLRPDEADPNLSMAGTVFAQPDIGFDDAIQQVAKPYGKVAKQLIEAWQLASDGVSLFPWDVSWKFRHSGHKHPFHSWEAFDIQGHLVDSPSWCSTRRAHFMTTENDELHPWFFEDIGLRFLASADTLQESVAAYDEALAEAGEAAQVTIRLWRTIRRKFAYFTRGFRVALYGPHSQQPCEKRIFWRLKMAPRRAIERLESGCRLTSRTKRNSRP